ncbi:MAG: type II toxin-antitoxin system Phd/YefM family antitoxin [Spirochaetes bacterium]|nr:type II toxin-antitoxin system Phd/YefM family antitoxin [Spirochaetota bacterium]
MQTLNIDKINNFNYINAIFEKNEPLEIINDSKKKIVISEEYWRSIQETLYLLSIPGMREKIVKGINTDIEDCIEDIEI